MTLTSWLNTNKGKNFDFLLKEKSWPIEYYEEKEYDPHNNYFHQFNNYENLTVKTNDLWNKLSDKSNGIFPEIVVSDEWIKKHTSYDKASAQDILKSYMIRNNALKIENKKKMEIKRRSKDSTVQPGEPFRRTEPIVPIKTIAGVMWERMKVFENRRTFPQIRESLNRLVELEKHNDNEIMIFTESWWNNIKKSILKKQKRNEINEAYHRLLADDIL